MQQHRRVLLGCDVNSIYNVTPDLFTVSAVSNKHVQSLEQANLSDIFLHVSITMHQTIHAVWHNISDQGGEAGSEVTPCVNVTLKEIRRITRRHKTADTNLCTVKDIPRKTGRSVMMRIISNLPEILNNIQTLVLPTYLAFPILVFT